MNSIKIKTCLKEKRALNYVIKNCKIPSDIKDSLENMLLNIQQEHDNYTKQHVEEDKLYKENPLTECCIVVKRQCIETLNATAWKHNVFKDPNITTLSIHPHAMKIRVRDSHISRLKEMLGDEFVITTTRKYY